MTAKRDLKKRVRERQAKTGESYTAARRHVVAARGLNDDVDDDVDDDVRADVDVAGHDAVAVDGADPDPDPDPGSDADTDAASGPGSGSGPDSGSGSDSDSDVDRPLLRADSARPHDLRAENTDGATSQQGPSAPISVDALVDVSTIAATVGLRCKILMSEMLAATLDPTRVLTAFRDVLLATLRDPAMDWLRALGLHGQVGPVALVRPSDPRHAQFVAQVRAGLGGTSPDGRALGYHLDGVAIVCAAWRRDATLVVCALEESLLHRLAGLGPPTAQPLVVPLLEFEGARHPMVKPRFVIGRHPTCDLQIKNGAISRRHAEVLRTERGWFIKDLESTSGVFYMGMQIDNKRIEEGDVFQLGEYAIRFTFHR